MKENRKPFADIIVVITQAFYGNRTQTGLKEKDIDQFIQMGSIGVDPRTGKPFPLMYPADRTIVRIPGTDRLILMYNRYMEEERLEEGRELFEKKGYKIKPLAEIPELELKIYSRCIALRMDEEGHLSSLEEEDYSILWKYLAP